MCIAILTHLPLITTGDTLLTTCPKLHVRWDARLAQDLDNVDHPAAELLRHWRDHGVPAETTSPPWTVEQRDTCVERGCHHSANQHSDFLREEMATFMESKFWMVLPYELIRELAELMLWPAVVKEE